MNSGKAARDSAHREATRLASEQRCLGCRAAPPSMPCHYPTHRGMGSGKAGWDPSEWVPLCWRCHAILDGILTEQKQHLIDNIESAQERGAWP